MRLLIVSDWGPWAGAEQSQIMRPKETRGTVYRKGDADSQTDSECSCVFCFCVRARYAGVLEQEARSFRFRKAMSHGTCVSFLEPPETEIPGNCRNIRRLKSEPELWSDLEPKQRGKPCRETSSLVLND